MNEVTFFHRKRERERKKNSFLKKYLADTRKMDGNKHTNTNTHNIHV